MLYIQIILLYAYMLY